MSENATAEKLDDTEDFKVEIVDDTPEQDRNRKPMPKEIVDELEKDDLEEYSEKVQTRLKQMKKVYHDERRAKEQFAREREEAVRFAQNQLEENKRLKQRLGMGEQALVVEAKRAANSELEIIRKKLQVAHETGDTDTIVKANEELADVKARMRDIDNFKPAPLQADEDNVKPRTTAQAPQPQPHAVDPKTAAWAKRNPWFNQDTVMTAAAHGIHYKLIDEGYAPGSDEYFEAIDSTMRKHFPAEFDDEGSSAQQQSVSRAKTANVVAPATRSTAPKQVRLTPTQVALAKKLGLSNEQYARELVKLENYNG